VKFSHTVFALPFALLAAFLAGASRGGGYLAGGAFWGQLALVVVCMVAGRSAAMAFNRIVDVRIDAANPRTANRPLQTGQVSPGGARVFFGLCCVVFLATAGGFWVLWGNPWPAAMALPVLAVLSGYSFTKRFTALCHLALGFALGLSPISAWLAVSPATFGLAPLMLGGAVMCWVGGFDILYSLQDIEFDTAHKLHSIPVAAGPAGALWISRGLHLLAVGALVGVWLLGRPHLGGIYLAGAGAAAAVLLVEQLLVTPKDFSRITMAFFTCNGAVSLVLGAAGIADILLS
jgi:4-hydroxybenzoate polyprenyltransferase